MSGILPLFNSAPRIRIRLNGNTLAYAIGFNINLSIDVQPISIIGSHQPVALEPLMANLVTGTMQIIKLVSRTNRQALKGSIPSREANKQIIKGSSAISAPDDAAGNNPMIRSDLYQHLDPRQVLSSKSFDIDLYLRIPTPGNNPVTAVGPSDLTGEALWLSIKDCRITSRNTNISMGSLVNEPLTFQGIYLTPTDPTGNDPLFNSDFSNEEKQSQ